MTELAPPPAEAPVILVADDVPANVELLFDLPGVRPDSIDLTVERNVLTVKAERRWSPEEGAEVIARERTHGTFSRLVRLGETLDAAHVEDSQRPGAADRGRLDQLIRPSGRTATGPAPAGPSRVRGAHRAPVRRRAGMGTLRAAPRRETHGGVQADPRRAERGAPGLGRR